MNNDITFDQKIEKILELLANEDLNLLPLIPKEELEQPSTIDIKDSNLKNLAS